MSVYISLYHLQLPFKNVYVKVRFHHMVFAGRTEWHNLLKLNLIIEVSVPAHGLIT